jgi:chain length determinant protein (polysaccharide antigen chain regulator)
MNVQTPNQAKPEYDDEIDLFELWQTIWSQKWMISIITLVITGFAALYLVLSEKTYQAEIVFMPPDNEGFHALNVQTNSVNTSFDSNLVFQYFKNELLSLEQQKAFFTQDQIQPFWPKINQNESPLSPNEITQKILKYYAERLNYSAPGKSAQRAASSLTLNESDPEIAAELLNSYFQFIINQTRSKLVADVKAKIDHRLSSIEQQINGLTQAAKQQAAQRITVLEEALHIAKQAGIHQQAINQQTLNNWPEYLKGTKLLQAEIDALKQRTNETAFIEEVVQLQAERNILMNIAILEDNVSPVRVDQYAYPPESPIKPKQKLILAVAFVLGGMLGIFIALIRGAIQKRRQNQTAF